MQFRNERQKQEYYKKLHLENLNIDKANSDKIASAYHDVDFGEIPAVSDNRSIAEREDDKNLQANLARKNVMQLMNDDGTEADSLLTKIGINHYTEFNKHYLDIYGQLKNRIGKIRAVEASEFIDKYINRFQLTGGVDIPNVEMLDNLLTKIEEKFNDKSSSAIEDIVMRLSALKATVDNGVKEEVYQDSNLPTNQEIKRIYDDFDDSNEIEDVINGMSDKITQESLEDVIDSGADENDENDTLRPEDDDETEKAFSVSSQEQSFERYKEEIATVPSHNKYQFYNDLLTTILDDMDDDDKEIPKKDIALLYKINGITNLNGKATNIKSSVKKHLDKNMTQILKLRDVIEDAEKNQVNMDSKATIDMPDTLSNNIELVMERYMLDTVDEAIDLYKQSVQMLYSNAKEEDETSLMSNGDMEHYNIINLMVTGRKATRRVKYGTALNKLKSVEYQNVFNSFDSKDTTYDVPATETKDETKKSPFKKLLSYISPSKKGSGIKRLKDRQKTIKNRSRYYEG